MRTCLVAAAATIVLLVSLTTTHAQLITVKGRPIPNDGPVPIAPAGNQRPDPIAEPDTSPKLSMPGKPLLFTREYHHHWQFPCDEYCAVMVWIAQTDKDEIDALLALPMLPGFRRQQLELIHREVKDIENAWWHAKQIVDPHSCIEHRNMHAQDLYELLGESNYMAGKLPMPVSLRRFYPPCK